MAFTVPKTYDPGDMITLTAYFYDKDGALADPSSVVLKVRNPLGIQEPHTPTKDAVGVYSYEFPTALGDPEGRYKYRFEGTGAVTSAEEKVFFLNPSDFEVSSPLTLHLTTFAPKQEVIDVITEEAPDAIPSEQARVERE